MIQSGLYLRDIVLKSS